jgi:hypothetical protein
MKLGIYIMTPTAISMAYFINPSLQPVCLHVHPTIVARQRLSKNVTSVTNTRTIIANCWMRRFLYGKCRIEGKASSLYINNMCNFIVNAKIYEQPHISRTPERRKMLHDIKLKNSNSMALVRKRTMATKRPPLVG